MRKVEILDLDGRIVDEGVVMMDNLDGTAIVECKRMGLINVPKRLLKGIENESQM